MKTIGFPDRAASAGVFVAGFDKITSGNGRPSPETPKVSILTWSLSDWSLDMNSITSACRDVSL
jgi:hypothetical protein